MNRSYGDDVERRILDLSDLLPKTPGHKIWSPPKDPEILCRDEKTAEAIADLFDAMYGEPTVNTGYYDPEEDKRNGEVDDRTGYYYVTVG